MNAIAEHSSLSTDSLVLLVPEVAGSIHSRVIQKTLKMEVMAFPYKCTATRLTRCFQDKWTSITGNLPWKCHNIIEYILLKVFYTRRKISLQCLKHDDSKIYFNNKDNYFVNLINV